MLRALDPDAHTHTHTHVHHIRDRDREREDYIMSNCCIRFFTRCLVWCIYIYIYIYIYNFIAIQLLIISNLYCLETRDVVSYCLPTIYRAAAAAFLRSANTPFRAEPSLVWSRQPYPECLCEPASAALAVGRCTGRVSNLAYF